MSSGLILIVAVFLGVSGCVAALALATSRPARPAEGRLQNFVQSARAAVPDDRDTTRLPHRMSFHETPASPLEEFVARFVDLRRWIVQAGLKTTPLTIVGATLGLGAVGIGLGWATGFSLVTVPLFAAVLGALPAAWLFIARLRRLARFEQQLPEGLELLARSLRAGHSLTEGTHLVGEEMAAPLGQEFAQSYQEQNLGMKLEDSLRLMTERVPSVDLRFFATAVLLQRQTGGDGAEILDKIGRLIRQRFQVRAQVKALTGEGRLSGLVLLAMPFALALYMLVRDPAHLKVLFTDPLGQKMVVAAIIAQILGALSIKKIVTIEV